MERIQININTPTQDFKELNYISMTECNGELLIKLKNEDVFDIHVGDRIIFKRFIYEEGQKHAILTDYVTVLSIEGRTIHTTLIPKYRIPVDSVKIISGITFVDETAQTYKYHLIKCKKTHNLFPQDAHSQEVCIIDYEGNILGNYKNVYVPLKRDDRPAVIEDCVTFVESSATCSNVNKTINYYIYEFLPEKISRDSILISDFDDVDIDKIAFIEFKHNPYYYYVYERDDNDNVKINEYDEPIKQYFPYEDNWWFIQIPYIFTGNKICINSGNTRSTFGINNAYWDINLGLGNAINVSSLGTEDKFNTTFVNDLEEALIPPIIDMERIKYSPMVCDDIEILEDGSKYAKLLDMATSITFNLHFRERNKIDISNYDIEMKQRAQNSSFTSGNVYTDGWYINPDSADTIWWNGMEYSESAFSDTVFSDFVNTSGEISDLLGCLNFTDNDVYYRKKKVSQSFLRLTFYNSTDPIEQKLLFHSTIFLDASTLYGKYIKQKMFMEENDLFNKKNNKDLNPNAAVVFCSADTVSARVDTKIVVTNEYDRTKSSEGFNVYLFAEDANFNFDENGEKTIYMKVEFNHAGNGKTIPMIMWPKFYWNPNKENENGSKGGYEHTDTYQPLTTNNFIESLYIPIKITYFKDRYVYYIPDAKNYMENGNISLILFEPKLDFDPLEGEQ